jgi:hypothetical protein
MTCTGSYNEPRDQFESRIDSLLREMVVEEAIGAIQDDRDVRSFSLQEISDYVGLGVTTLFVIEQDALKKFKNLMLALEEK